MSLQKGLQVKSKWIAVLCVGLLGCQNKPQEKTELKTQKDKISYSIGLDIGNTLKRQKLDVEAEVLAKGIRDGLADSAKALMTQEQIRETMEAFQKEMMAKQQSSMQKLAEEKKKEGEAFLADNGKKEGVVTLPSGLQYKVIKSGTGPTPKASDTVTTHYRGTLTDGTEFDSSYKQGKPVEFPVGRVITGWQEALQKMKVGDKWQLFVPAQLGYGPNGNGPIPPNATLIFEMELLSIK
ncbi:MAG: FKBP-type peptidyl-prolyl cis-trans isomerase [Candidatus Latescibacteria bacterium]|nr:FKBP-type peptidyl-prolyl cis-trans isomerase [Candidatus Latescibacterota bacterium]